MAYFELKGRPRPPGSKSIEAYLANRSGKRDLRLFPTLDHCWPDHPDWPIVSAEMLADRFEWATKFFYTTPQELYGAWCDDDLWHKERVATWPELQQDEDYWEAQFRSYRTLGLSLLRDEVRNVKYLRSLRDSLSFRIKPGEPVLFVGPTAGGEVEAIADSRALPVFVTSGGECSDLAEERLLHDKIDYETYWSPSYSSLGWRARYVVLSSYLPNPRATIAAAYEAVGMYGFVLCETNKMVLVQELEAVGLYRTTDPGCACFFKHPDLPLHLGVPDGPDS